MGMFDYVKINKNILPLSDIDKSKLKGSIEWQTKDLDNALYTINIGKNRILKVDGLKRYYTGIINFYTILSEKQRISFSPKTNWLEFTATFIDGRLIDIAQHIEQWTETKILNSINTYLMEEK